MALLLMQAVGHQITVWACRHTMSGSKEKLQTKSDCFIDTLFFFLFLKMQIFSRTRSISDMSQQASE